MIKKIIVGLTILAISGLSSVASLSSTAKTRALRRRRIDIEVDDSFNNNKIAAAKLKIDGKVFATKGGNVAINNAATAGNSNKIEFEQD